MSYYGMQLRKLELTSESKENAMIKFNSGLNIIAGASDTGKSFVFECINYLLGSTDVPQIPKEATGYTGVLLEFLDKKSQQIITIKRSLNDNEKNDVYYIYSDISKISEATYEKLAISSRAANNLSSKLLSICNCSYRNVLSKVSNGETETFTFRKFATLMMLNETRIVQKNSPIYIGDNKRDKTLTKETASFFTVLTGIDYEKYIKTESVEIKKARLKGAIDELTLVCSSLQKEIALTEDLNPSATQLQESELIINKYEKSLQSQREIAETLEKKQQEALVTLNNTIRDKNRVLDNITKFKLLKKNYQSDINRLDFIEQAHDYTGQLANIQCPICHNKIAFPPTETDSNDEVFYIAIQKEKEKLKSHLTDLQDTIDDFEFDLTAINEKILSEEKIIQAFESELKEQTCKISSILIEHESHLKNRDKLLSIEANKQKLNDTKKRIEELYERLENTKKNSEKATIKKPANEIINDFCSIVRDLLESWRFITDENNSVIFNNKDNDVIVNSKEKATYGKGARAIINSAFIISIMNYCFSHGLSHPGFVILDSPLTTYKKRDRQANLKNEEVENSVKTQFFYSLAEMSKDKQIIIFDNEIPPTDISGVTYHHFSGNSKIGRAGFIPETNDMQKV